MREVLQNGTLFANEGFLSTIYFRVRLYKFGGPLNFRSGFFMLNLLLKDNPKPFAFKDIFSNVLSQWYYYVVALLLVALMIFFFMKKKPKFNREYEFKKSQKIVYISMLAALCTVANIFDINLGENYQLSLVATVGFVAGYLFGGNWAFCACFIGDFLGALINPHGVYNPILGVGTGLWGLIPGIIFTYFNWRQHIKIAVSYLVSYIVVSCIVNTFGLYLMYNFIDPLGLIVKLVVVIVNYVISLGLMSALLSIRNYVYGKRIYTSDEIADKIETTDADKNIE